MIYLGKYRNGKIVRDTLYTNHMHINVHYEFNNDRGAITSYKHRVDGRKHNTVSEFTSDDSMTRRTSPRTFQNVHKCFIFYVYTRVLISSLSFLQSFIYLLLLFYIIRSAPCPRNRSYRI